MRPDAPSAPPFERIGIVGLGLVGGSIALRVRRQWPSVHIAGVDAAGVLASAIERRIIWNAVAWYRRVYVRNLVMRAME
jgi:prephenate dehydrogenase